MNKAFSLSQRVLHHIMCKTYEITNYGLFEGTMGVCVSLYIISKRMNNKGLKTYADRLLSFCLGNLPMELSNGFSEGLLGIAWSVDFLLYYGFISGNSKEICEEIDSRIWQISPLRLDGSLKYGLKGVLHYVLAHACHNPKDSDAFDANFLMEVFCALQKLQESEYDTELNELLRNFINWYKGLSWKYEFNLERFVELDSSKINVGNFQMFPIGLNSGLCGYLIKDYHEGYGFIGSI
nr:hypothetical protein [Prevotella sp.]